MVAGELEARSGLDGGRGGERVVRRRCCSEEEVVSGTVEALEACRSRARCRRSRRRRCSEGRPVLRRGSRSKERERRGGETRWWLPNHAHRLTASHGR